MSEAGRIAIVEGTGEPIATITVGIIELKDDNTLGAAPGFYFTFPKPQTQPGDTIGLHGPFSHREDALEAAGTYLINRAEDDAEAALDIQADQELAA